MKLTDTNRPRACHTTHASHKDPCPASTMRYPKTHTTQQNKTINLCHEPVPVAIARGKHPDPSRTRKLSLPALMVLHTPVCGRVRRRRTTHPTPPQPTPGCGGATTPPPKPPPNPSSGFTPIRARGIGRSPIIRGDSREKELRGRGSASHPRWITNQLNHLRGSQYPEIPRPRGR